MITHNSGIESILIQEPNSLRLYQETNFLDNHLVLSSMTKEGSVVESSYCLGYGRRKYIFTLSSQIGCPLRCNFCETADLPYNRNLTSQEILDQALIVAKRTYANGFTIENKPLKIAFVEVGEPLLNEQLIDGIRMIDNIFDCSLKISTIFPRHQTAYANLNRVIEYTKKRTDETQIQLSLHSSDEIYRRSIVKFPLASFDEIGLFGKEWHEKAHSKRKITLTFTLAENAPCRPRDIVKTLSPKYFAVRLRNMLSTETSRTGNIKAMSRENINCLEQRFAECGYYIIPGETGDIETEFNLSPGALTKMVKRGQSIVLPPDWEQRIRGHKH